jgi:hypothetical protein
MLPYALTIFTGAFLLFQIQPLIGKFILPWFGGGPGVWTTCLLFFQTLLLGGYAYAHFSSTRLKPKAQAVVHLVLLALALALLPVAPADSWKAHIAGNPVGHILLLLTVCVGLPYFVLSSTGPLMQQWFSRAHPGVSPYRLYALSNVGSLLALLSYPFFFEVKFSRHTQATLWSAGLGVFVLCCGYCALRLWRSGETAPASAPDDTTAQSSATSWSDKALWLALPALASVLLLATTNKLCQEVAVVPFLWVLPLALYLLSFIVCFDHARWYRRGLFVALLAIAAAVVCDLLNAGSDAPMTLQIAGYTVALFVACMVAHGELYRLKPPPRDLTSYYLFIAAGGALGGFLVAIVAPAVFTEFRELQIGWWLLWVAVAVISIRQQSRTLVRGAGVGALAVTLALPWLRSRFSGGAGVGGELLAFYRDHMWIISGALVAFIVAVFDVRRRRLESAWQPRMGGFVTLLAAGLGAVFMMQGISERDATVLRASRNFYGTLKVFDYLPDSPDEHYRLLMHGATTHGLQFVAPEKALLATSYYGEHSGVGLALNHLPRESGRKLGLVGLGTGTLAVYGQKGDTLRIYEINPAVEKLAHDPFTHLAYSQAKIDVVMGDARLSLEQELAAGQPQQFDLLALDAFSSDAIPAHLLTKEAFELYLKHLRPDGVIAVHISNRYLDLEPVVRALVQHFNLNMAVISDDYEAEWWFYETTWILVTKNKTFLAQPAIEEATDLPSKTPRPPVLWTDDQTSLYEILR